MKIEFSNKSEDPIKRCSCGFRFEEIPANAKLLDSDDELAGYYWNCNICRTTLFMPRAKLERLKVSMIFES